MKETREIDKEYIIYYSGKLKAKYRGEQNEFHQNQYEEFYNLDFYDCEINDVKKVDSIPSKETKKINLDSVKIEHPEDPSTLFIENLSDAILENAKIETFKELGQSFGIVRGEIYFQVEYYEKEVIEIITQPPSPQPTSPKLPFPQPTQPEPPPPQPTPPKPPISPVIEKQSFWGCLSNLIGIIVLIILFFLALMLIIKAWKVAIVIGIIVGILWLMNYFGKSFFKVLWKLLLGLFILSIICILFFALAKDRGEKSPYNIDEDRAYVIEDDKIPDSWKKEIVDTLKRDTSNNNLKGEFFYKTLSWRDYSKKYHKFKYKVFQDSYSSAKKNRSNFISYKNSWREIYYNLYSNDYGYLDEIISKYDSIKGDLGKTEFAELIFSSIQYQPYTWILHCDCNNSKYKYQIANSGFKCLGDIRRYAVQSPYEFLSNQLGDCDTKTLFLYSILKYYKYDVVILTSDYYEHAMLGINIPSYGKYKKYNGKKYYVWETTSKNMEIGQINSSVSNMSLWKITLK